MNKKILALGLVLALVAVMVVPMAVSADDSTVSGTVPGAPTISSLVANTGDVNTVPVITINGTGFVDGQTTVSIDGTGITPGSVTFVSVTQITCPFTISANAMSGARNVKVTVYGVDSSTLPFTVNIYVTLVVPTTVSLGTLNFTQANNSAAQTISFTTNEAAKTYATVAVKGTNAGKLYLNPTALSSALSLGGNGFTTVSLTGGDQTLVDSTQGALSGTPKTWSKTTLVITQPAFNAVAAGSYSCTITFTATVSP